MEITMTLNTGTTINYIVAPNFGNDYTRKDISNIQRWVGIFSKEDDIIDVKLECK